MSPDVIDKVRRGHRLLLAGALLLASGGAGAIVGASSEAHPMARSSVMVLNSRGGVCSAVVVAPDVVLTAGHCVAGGGEHRVHWKAGGAPVLVAPAEVKRHPGFSAGAEKTRQRSIDLALVRLPAALPGAFGPASLSTGGAAKGAGVTVAGYGVAREGDGRSSGTFRAAALNVVEPYGPGRILLWAAPPAGEAGACQGDSGGPLLDERDRVVAITSWARGRSGKACGELTQGVLVAPQRAWIDTILSHWSRTANWN